MTYSDLPSEENGQSPWTTKSRLDISTFKAKGDETTKQEISYYDNIYEEVNKIGATNVANKIAEAIEEYKTGSAKVEKARRLIESAMTDYISKQENFKKDDDDTLKRMREDR
jgi:hypothetical protein